MKTSINIVLLSLVLSSYIFLPEPTASLTEDSLLERAVAVQLIKICHRNGKAECSADLGYAVENINACEGVVTVQFYAANLKKANEGGLYHLPDNMPAIHLAFDDGHGTKITSDAITDFRFFELMQGFQNTTIPIYIAEVEFVIDLSNYAGDVDVHYKLPFELSVIGTDKEIYKVQEYGGPNGVFSCLVFAETCIDCGNCESDLAQEAFRYKAVACGTNNYCENSQSGVSAAETLTLATVHVSPNPFADYINIELGNINSANLSIVVNDMNGRVVKEYKNLDESNWLSIDAKNWESSNYLITIYNGVDKEVFKVFKL